jgi:hypothetical protein
MSTICIDLGQSEHSEHGSGAVSNDMTILRFMNFAYFFISQ